MEHDQYRDILFTLGVTFDLVLMHGLRYSGRHHPYADVFRRLDQRLGEPGSLTATVLVTAAVRTAAN